MPNVMPPGQAVLEAWGANHAELLAGGQGETFRAGDLVLKPALEANRAAWLAATLERLPTTDHLRIVRPVRSRVGTWVVDGWTAWQWLAGEHRLGAYDEVLAVSSRFHAAVADVPWSPAAAGRDRWADADRIAWGELDRTLPPEMAPLLAARRPVELPAQLVHGDLGGNVLFHETLPPAVIDVSPYWRPAGYADAIVVADAVAWERAGDELVERHLAAWGTQLLLRAVLFRVAAAADPTDVEAYRHLVRLLAPQAARPGRDRPHWT